MPVRSARVGSALVAARAVVALVVVVAVVMGGVLVGVAATTDADADAGAVEGGGSSWLVTIEPGVLPEAKSAVRDRLRAGEWAYTFPDAHDAAFFKEEDAASRQWQQRKVELRLLHERWRSRQKDVEQTDREGGDTPVKGGDGEQRGAGAVSLTEYFTERRVQRRQIERLKQQALHNVSGEEGVAAARALVEAEVESLWHRVAEATAGDTAAYEQYLGLVERHFPHTVVNTTAATAAPSAVASGLPTSLLRLPLVLDGAVLPVMEREVTNLRELWRRRRASGEAGPTDVNLQRLFTVVEESKSVAVAVATLVEPVADAAVSWVAATLTATRAAIVVNDESTEAKRAELKQLLRRQSRLREVTRVLEKHSKTYQSVVRRGQLPNAEATLVALQLLAQQRLGDEVSGLVEELPVLSTTAPLSGLLEQEWRTHLCAPFGFCVLVTAAIVWVCEELKERCLSRVRASRLRPPERSLRGVVTAAPSRARHAFMMVAMVELAAPALLPAVVLLAHLRGVKAWVWAAVALMRPSQRALCLATVLCLTVANCAAATAAKRLFQFVDPAVCRRRIAKTK
ncbi:hypothetical protein NESM_000237200 [Novymonas esmeraldas]|uniref:Uncharacterized protein n=1 Tax=Novymonas esmeraldas TaxID=1808958 RepID=A0AAW0F634_9TRYP